MAKKLYETTAVNIGGREGHGFLTDGTLKIDVSTPKELGGQGDGANPEQLFALGYSACYHSAMTQAKKDNDLADNDSRVRVAVGFESDKGEFNLTVKIEVGIDGADLDTTRKVAEIAHETCPYSRAIKGNVPVEVTAVAFDEIESEA